MTETTTSRVVVEEWTDDAFPGHAVVIEKETSLSTSPRTQGNRYPYGIGQAWNLRVYISDILVYDTSYFGDLDGLHRAQSDAHFFLRGQLPPGFYSGGLTFEDVRYDRDCEKTGRKARLFVRKDR